MLFVRIASWEGISRSDCWSDVFSTHLFVKLIDLETQGTQLGVGVEDGQDVVEPFASGRGYFIILIKRVWGHNVRPLVQEARTNRRITSSIHHNKSADRMLPTWKATSTFPLDRDAILCTTTRIKH